MSTPIDRAVVAVASAASAPPIIYPVALNDRFNATPDDLAGHRPDDAHDGSTNWASHYRCGATEVPVDESGKAHRQPRAFSSCSPNSVVVLYFSSGSALSRSAAMVSPLVRAHAVKALMGSSSVRPSSVRLYSTRGGASAYTWRATSPWS